MPDTSGNFRGISVPRIPWHEPLPNGPCKGCPDVEHCGSVGCAVGLATGALAKATDGEK